MASNTVLLAIASLTLGVAAYVAVSLPKAGEGAGGADVAALEERLRAAEKRADAVEGLRAEVRALRERIERGEPGEIRVEGRPGRAAAPSPEAPAGAPETGEPASGSDLVEAVAERVAKKMDERLDRTARRAGQYSDDGRWKAPLDDLSEELALTEAQKGDLKRAFDSGKDQGFALLQTQRLDGTTLLDDYVAALKAGGDPASATQEFFKRIVSERVPGTDQTYLAGFLTIAQEVDSQVGRHLDPAQRQKMRSLRVAVLEVETGYDPTGDWVRAKLQ